MKEFKVMVEGSIIGKIIEIMESGKFAEHVQPAKEGANVLGEANAFEKACATIRKQAAEEYLSLRMEALEFFFRPSETGMKKAKDLRKLIDLAEALLWDSVRSRIKDADGKNLSLCTGYQIVQNNGSEDEECNCPACQMKRILEKGDGSDIDIGALMEQMFSGRGGSGMTVIEVSRRTR